MRYVLFSLTALFLKDTRVALDWRLLDGCL